MGDIILTLELAPWLVGGGVLGVAASVAEGAAGPVVGDKGEAALGLGGVTCGGGAAGMEAGIVDDVALGGVTGGIKEHEVLSGDWTLGLARLGSGDDGGDQEPQPEVAATAASGPAVMAAAAAALAGNSLVASVDPQTLKVSRHL